MDNENKKINKTTNYTEIEEDNTEKIEEPQEYYHGSKNVEKKFKNAMEEIKYIEEHPDEYKSYDNREDLKKALLSDD